MAMNSAAEQNIQHFRRRLEYGAEEVTRSVLLKLLLAEEKMLGLTEQQLRRLDRHIAKLRQLISQQTTRIERLACFGIGTEGHRLVLTTLNDLMATYQIHRQRITAALAGNAEQ
jgi:N-acetylmuramic acid 6-phosphate (MurNAc-6-P) etherase